MLVPKEGQQPRFASSPRFCEAAPAPLGLHVAATRGTSVESAVTSMLRMGLNALPVVDAVGRLLGTRQEAR